MHLLCNGSHRLPYKKELSPHRIFTYFVDARPFLRSAMDSPGQVTLRFLLPVVGFSTSTLSWSPTTRTKYG